MQAGVSCGTGFLVHIKNPDKNEMEQDKYGLFTCFHVVQNVRKPISKLKDIKIIFESFTPAKEYFFSEFAKELKKDEFKISENRQIDFFFVELNEKFVTEMKESEAFFEKFPQSTREIGKLEEVVIPQYPLKEKCQQVRDCCRGTLQKSEKGHLLLYVGKTAGGSSGAPILIEGKNGEDDQVLAIHRGVSFESADIKQATFISPIIHFIFKGGYPMDFVGVISVFRF